MKKKYIAVLNCGSSSVKFAVFKISDYSHLYHGLIENIGSGNEHLSYIARGELHGSHVQCNNYPQAISMVLSIFNQDKELLTGLFAIGHRVVHGGSYFTQPILVNADNIAEIEKLIPLAPLHNAINILGIKTCMDELPGLANIAVFDTAFHNTLPEYVSNYPIDKKITSEYGIRKYGFHGVSHNYVYNKMTTASGKTGLNVISIHLGSGCSVCAIKNGESVDVSMGMTPLAGLMMGTRCGDIDPGLHQYLMAKMNVDVATLTDILNKRSGLLGVSQLSSDLREIIPASKNGNLDSLLALDMFCYTAAKYIASYMVPLQHCDALVFTAGIGENNPQIRASIVELLSFLGVKLNFALNDANGADNGVISASNSSIPIYVVRANEELMIAGLVSILLEVD